MKKVIGVLACAAVVLFTAGCASLPAYRCYKGPERPNNKLTKLAVPSEIQIVHIDGVTVKEPAVAEAGRGARELIFVPGTHFLDVHLVLPWEKSRGVPQVIRSSLILLEFNGKPGMRYSLMRHAARTWEEANKLESDPGLTIQASSWSSP